MSQEEVKKDKDTAEKETQGEEKSSQENKKSEEAESQEKRNSNNPFFQPKKKKRNYSNFVIFGLLALFLLYPMFTPQVPQKTLNDFEDNLKVGKIEKILVINKERVEVYLVKDAKVKDVKERSFMEKMGVNSVAANYYFTIGSVDELKDLINKTKTENPTIPRLVKVYETRTSFWEGLIGWLPLLIMIGIWVFFFRKMGRGAMPDGGSSIFNIGKSKAREFNTDSQAQKTTFKNVAGLKEVKVEIQELVEFLKNPHKYTDLGGKIPKGALLIGPPGTGKTLLAKAVAGEANVPFFSISGSDFVEMFVGVGASRVRDLFAQAKAKSPCIIFIDEIDAIGRARNHNPNMGSNDERENTLNQLLTEMDGFDTNKGVIILAATNRQEILDKALLRAGRFDRQITFELPDLNERKEILDVHIKGLKLGPDVELEFFAKQTPGFSGADLANLCNEAALYAARRNKKVIEKQDFLDAIDRIVGGLEKKNKIITKDERRAIACHEIGHALTSWMLEHAHPLVKITIVPRGNALGAAWYLPKERQLTTQDELQDEMCSLLGGRAAEELVFGKVSTGALNDLERVTKIAYAMVTYYGMSEKVGNISYFDSTRSEYSFTKPYSDRTAELIDAEIKVIINNQYERAKKLIKDNWDGFIKLSDIILENEVIFSENVEEVLGKRPFITPEKYVRPLDESEKTNEVSEDDKKEIDENTVA